MKRLILVVMLIITGGGLVRAQSPTDTPTPQPTYTPYSFDDMVGTLGIPTQIPALSLTPKVWATPTRYAPGTPFLVPEMPVFLTPSAPIAHGFEAISEENVLELGRYFAEIAVGFYGWLVVTMPYVLRALRIISLIFFLMATLFAVMRRFAPELASAKTTLYERAERWRTGRGS